MTGRPRSQARVVAASDYARRGEIVRDRVQSLPRTALSIVEPFVTALPVPRMHCVEQLRLGDGVSRHVLMVA